MQLLLNQTKFSLILVSQLLPKRLIFLKMSNLERKHLKLLSSLLLLKPINQPLHPNRTNPPKALSCNLSNKRRLSNKISSQLSKCLHLFSSLHHQLNKTLKLCNSRKQLLVRLSNNQNLSKRHRLSRCILSRLRLKFLKIKAKKPLLQLKVLLLHKLITFKFNNKNNLSYMISLNSKNQR